MTAHIRRDDLSPDGTWFTEAWSNGQWFSVKVKEVLRDLHSPFQHLRVLDTEDLGRVMVLDIALQVAERGEAPYHEMIVHPGLCRRGAGTPTGAGETSGADAAAGDGADGAANAGTGAGAGSAEAAGSSEDGRRVLVIGGGDGGSAREALRHPDVVGVDLVDIDPEVTRAAAELLPSVWRRPDGSGPLHEDPRLTVRNEDGLAFVEASDQPDYDLVVVDATDPVGPGAVLFSERFYSAIRRRLRPGGAVAVQAGSWHYFPDVLRTAHQGLSAVFERAEPYQCWSPVYPGGLWNLVIATFGDDPADVDEARAAKLTGCEWYTAETHRAAFVLPPVARAAVDSTGP